MNTDRQKITVRRQKIKKNHTKRKLLIFGTLAALLILTAVFAREICPYDPNRQDYSIALQPPSLAHPFGTDRYGRDMLSRVIAGSQISIFSTLALVAIIAVTGTAVGVICGYFGKAVDSIVMRISDICLAFPGLVFALAIASVLERGDRSGSDQLAQICQACPKSDADGEEF